MQVPRGLRAQTAFSCDPPRARRSYMSNHPRGLSHLPTLFLGGSASCLQHLHLSNSGITQITFFPPLTSSFVTLGVFRLLGILHLGFRSSLSPDRTRCYPPPLMRIVLPAVTIGTLCFSGISEDLEDFVFRIVVPLLGNVHMINSSSMFRNSSSSYFAQKSSGIPSGLCRAFPAGNFFFPLRLAQTLPSKRDG